MSYEFLNLVYLSLDSEPTSNVMLSSDATAALVEVWCDETRSQ